MNPTSDMTGNTKRNVLILHTKHQDLLRRLKEWAHRTDSVILINPTTCDSEQLNEVFALVIDGDLIPFSSIQEEVYERLIPSELNHDLIVRILDGLRQCTPFTSHGNNKRAARGR